MRLLILGMVLGLVLGSVAMASASFVSTDIWGRGMPQSEFHLGYVAGIVDTVEALRSASFFTRQQTAEALDAIDRCTHNIQLGLLTARAEQAVANSQTYPSAADVIMGNFLKCQQ